MRIKILAASCALLLVPAVATAAPPPALMTPTGPWNVEFADSMCLLSRPYGKTNLVLKPAMLGDGLEIIVTRATTSIGDVKYGKAVLTISGKAADGDVYFTANSTPKLRLIRIQAEGDKVPLSSIRGTLAIDAARESRHLFDVAGIGRALPVLSGCVDQLRAIYKVSKADLAAIVTMPEGLLARIFSSNDYPLQALSKEQFGTAGVLVWVEPNGRISTCEVIESSAAAPLDFTTCDVLKRRGRLIPGKDIQGKAVRAPAFVRIRWLLPTS